MNMKIPGWLKPAFWGGVVGAVAITIIGFAAGWIVTSGAAQDMADQRAEKAVVSSLTPICVAQFKHASQQQRHLAALEEESSWLRGDYVEEHGWATMPGGADARNAVADACAEELMKMAS